jgi:hypothetical protein
LTVRIGQSREEERKRMAKPELEFHRPTGPWVAAEGPVRGIWTQTLAEDPATGHAVSDGLAVRLGEEAPDLAHGVGAVNR